MSNSPVFDNGCVQLYLADAREIPLPDQSVHCVVTSPPYFGLRVYQDNDGRGIGLEASIEVYVANLVDVFREVWRVLRDDGVCWVNLGDSYGGYFGDNYAHKPFGEDRTADDSTPPNKPSNGANAGNRLGIPERVVMALQSDGWVWRDTVIWAKKSAMPESVNGWRWERCRVKVDREDADWQVRPKGWQAGKGSRDEIPDGNYRQNGKESSVATYVDCPGCPNCEASDGLVLRRGSWRTTSSHEYIYMLTKGMGYFCDAEAVRQGVTGGAHSRGAEAHIMAKTAEPGSGIKSNSSWDAATWGPVSSRNRRSVWNDISPEPYGGSHFATFPSDLPRICIQASTSEKGVCPECGSQWARVVERQATPDESYKGSSFSEGKTAGRDGGDRTQEGERFSQQTIGWRATCGHDGSPVPATVLDPFCGTATTCVAAQKLGRRAVGVDISESYLEQAVKRLTSVPLPLVLGT